MDGEGQNPWPEAAYPLKGVTMPTYIRLVNLTDQAVRNVQKLGDMLADARKILEGNGCTLVQAWSTLGAYDVVAVLEGPDDATVMKAVALVAKAGNFRAVTLPAVPMADFIASVK